MKMMERITTKHSDYRDVCEPFFRRFGQHVGVMWNGLLPTGSSFGRFPHCAGCYSSCCLREVKNQPNSGLMVPSDSILFTVHTGKYRTVRRARRTVFLSILWFSPQSKLSENWQILMCLLLYDSIIYINLIHECRNDRCCLDKYNTCIVYLIIQN